MYGIWIGLALGVALACIICSVVLHFRVMKPLKRLSELTQHLGEMDAESLDREAKRITGAPGKAARGIAAHLAAEEGGAETGRSGPAAAQEQYRMRVVDEICRSLLPQALKDQAASMNFALAGDIQQGTRRNCAFYDFFFLDENTLCFAVGEVPGDGIAEALFAVVAQTTIRSRLRMGHSLVETMSDVNAQLYDLGGRNSVSALVCVLNTVSGRLSFVNAGNAIPFMMRSEEGYEWLRTPVYAPLGANESVTYRSETLRLNQGDRLFLYTSDLGEMVNRDGEEFRTQEFQSALNRSRSKTRSTEELLHFVQNEAAAFCESGDDVLSSAVLALEYKKGNRDYVFTMVESTPEQASLVTDFLRKTLEERGVAPKERAKQILLADELFALCCRDCRAGEDIKVACAVLPEENSIHLRMFAPLGGQDPLRPGEDAAGAVAANYIRTHAKRASFEAGIERDMVELVSDLN